MSTLEFALAALLVLQSAAWIATDFVDRAPSRTTVHDHFGEDAELAMRRTRH
ncbi:hypothetical protein [Rhodococcus aetherivorans]|uniref:hypothetical protein n=1 Tax=Rhodococcus aetherivorans TaxID=191292 RepID=UPI00241D99D9|nr:hypothetical protein [Rhodococcus aetherivorans]WFS11852.1 hypothetical protein P9K37_18835 [Rhodococcus aetherivorans]